MNWFAQLPPWIDQGSYFVVFTLLVCCGMGLPLPEEVTFLLGGFLVDKIDGNLWLMILMGICGVLVGDTLLFFLARHYGLRLMQKWPFRLLFTDSRMESARNFFIRHGSKTVFFAGFFAGVRAPAFFLSSTMGVSYPRFLFWDGLRTLLTCPISIWFGFQFGTYAQEKLEPYRNWLLGCLGFIVILILLKSFLGKKASSHPEVQPQAKTNPEPPSNKEV